MHHISIFSLFSSKCVPTSGRSADKCDGIHFKSISRAWASSPSWRGVVRTWQNGFVNTTLPSCIYICSTELCELVTSALKYILQVLWTACFAENHLRRNDSTTSAMCWDAQIRSYSRTRWRKKYRGKRIHLPQYFQDYRGKFPAAPVGSETMVATIAAVDSLMRSNRRVMG